MCIIDQNKAFYFNGNQTFYTWVRQLQLEGEIFFKKSEKQILRKCVTMGQEHWRMQLGGRGEKLGWEEMMLCVREKCAFLPCTTRELAI
jgi:hypothetical protein